MEQALLGVVAIEPWLFGAVALVMAAAALLAAAVPARSAAATDPVGALRGE